MMVRRSFTVLFILASFVLIPRSVFAHDLCYPDKSPHCLKDPFSDYWEKNGGLPVFGYPITAAVDETNVDTGKTYNTQWVERNRLEIHPENTGTPYEILLGLLGKDRLRQQNRDPNVEPREGGPKNGCLWFEQTGHNICNLEGNLGFKTYWETHGLSIGGLDKYSQSLQLFGLPLTEPKLETNCSGSRVITQWFERARFEWHPQNPNEYKVLLGLLGKEVRDNAQCPPNPASVPPPPPPPPPKSPNCNLDAGPGAPNSPINIVAINKGAETVSIRNMTGAAVNVTDWWICSITGNQLHAVLDGTIAPGQTVVINSQASGNIWNNSSHDPGALYDSQGNLISYH